MSFDDVARRMQERHSNGLPPTTAAAQSFDGFAQSLADTERRTQKTNDIVFGSLLLGVGLIITMATYGSVSESGGTYIVAYGPMIVGAIKLFRGLAS